MSDDHEQSPAQKIVEKTPWWAISVGLHTLGVLILGFFVVMAIEAADTEVTVVRRLKKVEPPPEFKKNQPVEKLIEIPNERVVETPTLTREEDDHDETMDFEDFQKAKGDPSENSDKPFRGPAMYDVIGGGGGGGGRNGTPFGGRMHKRQGMGRASPQTEDAVLEALKWLARHQSADGSWGVQGYLGQCREGNCNPNPPSASADFDAGVTGLSMLAFLGAGYSHLSKEVHEGINFGDVVRKGLQWMLERQDPEGFIGPHTQHKEMYNHTICALALAEAYGLTGSGLFKENAQKAIDYIVASQNGGRGWRYSYKSGDNDTSVTGWAVMALKSAELSGLVFPASAYQGARAWLDEVTEDNYGRVGYTHRNTGKVFCGHNAEYDHQEALTAISVMSRIFMDRSKSDPRVSSGASMLMRDLPTWEGKKIDFYMWYYTALALFQYDGPSGPTWSKWNKSMVSALVKPQNTRATGCKRGSWEPVDRWSCEGGRVYATAINALTLEIYYRYNNVIGKSR